MKQEETKINILIINNDLSETDNIKSWLYQDMRIPWSISHCINMKEARSRINKAHIVILKPEMEGWATPQEIFKDVENIAFETPIIVLANRGHDQNGLSTFVMEQGAADILIRGQFSRLVDAIEFALIRQKITTNTRKVSDKKIQDNQDVGDAKYKDSCDKRSKDQEERKNTLSMFMGGYSVSGQEPDKKETE